MGKIGSIYFSDPLDLAKTVVEHWKEGDTEKWTDKYREGINRAKSDADKLRRMVFKIAAYYEAMREEGLPDKYAEVMGKVKSRMKSILKTGRVAGKTLAEIEVP